MIESFAMCYSGRILGNSQLEGHQSEENFKVHCYVTHGRSMVDSICSCHARRQNSLGYDIMLRSG